MAQMLASGRGLGILSLHRAFWKVGCKQKLFVVGRIHPATLKELPLRPKPQRGQLPLNTRLPRQFALNCALPDASPPSPSQDEPVILSSKECPDGSILFVFGSPGQQVSEEVAAGAGKELEPSDVDVDEADAIQNGSTTKELKVDDEEMTLFSADDTKLEEKLESLSIKDTSVTENPEVETKDAATSLQDESSDSVKSAIDKGVLRLRSGGAIRPHPSKVKTGGEDAYLIEGEFWAGVADGVGGWAASGIDSGLYSRELMKNCGVLTKSENGTPDPKSVIIKGVKRTQAVGSCTAVLAGLHSQMLYIANVGDSGFLLIRDGKVLARSKPMQHGFNFPFQIGSEGDDPATAETFEINVASGDVLVLATDGVYDNLYEREIVDIVDSGQKKGVEPGTIAMWLVRLAHQAGLNTEGRSPFSDAAHAAGYSYEGGKLDDATVVVSYIE